MSDAVLAEQAAPHVRLIKLNRPDQRNAINAELCVALHDELGRAAADRCCRAIVVTGEGRAFCAGLDLHGYGQAPGNDGVDQARDQLLQPAAHVAADHALRATPQPVIAAVNGPAAGFGLALALASDIRYRGPRARSSGRSFVNIGAVELRHVDELAPPAADRRLALPRADAHRPARGGRGGRADRPRRRRRRRRRCSSAPSRPPSRSPPGRRGASG